MTKKKNCNSKSNSFVAAAEQVCLQPVLEVEHWQRRGRRNIACQAIPHLCSSNRKGTTSDSWPTTGRNVKLFSGGGPEPASVRNVGDTCEWRRQVRWKYTCPELVVENLSSVQFSLSAVNTALWVVARATTQYCAPVPTARVDTSPVGNESAPKITTNDKINLLTYTAISIC